MNNHPPKYYKIQHQQTVTKKRKNQYHQQLNPPQIHPPQIHQQPKKRKKSITTPSTTNAPEIESNNNNKNKAEPPKEEESIPSSPKPTIDPSTTGSSETENNNKSESLKEEELLTRGTALLLDGTDYNEAVSLLSNALEIVQQKQNATSIESVKYYMAYGEALLRLIQSCNDLFAAPIREKQQQHIAEQEENEEEQEEEAPALVHDAVAVTDNTETKENKVETVDDAANGKEEQEEENEDVGIKEDDNDNETEKEENDRAESAMTGNGDVDTSEDREIAWETFEYARVVIEDYLAIKENENDMDRICLLGKVHSFLGEILIEDEKNELALDEFVKALSLQNKCGINISYRQKAYNHYMACLAAQFSEKDDEALKHCKTALDGLSKGIIELLKGFECNQYKEEGMEYNELLQITKSFMSSMDDESKYGENGKELNDLTQSMTDLMCKLEEVEQMIKQKKLNPKPMDNDNNNNGNLLGDDPLSALIQGLTQKFGINQQDLAEMDDDNKNNDDDDDIDGDKKRENVNDAGITTIGFGNNNNEKSDDLEVNDLGSFGGQKKQKKKKFGTS